MLGNFYFGSQNLVFDGTEYDCTIARALGHAAAGNLEQLKLTLASAYSIRPPRPSDLLNICYHLVFGSFESSSTTDLADLIGQLLSSVQKSKAFNEHIATELLLFELFLITRRKCDVLLKISTTLDFVPVDNYRILFEHLLCNADSDTVKRFCESVMQKSDHVGSSVLISLLFWTYTQRRFDSATLLLSFLEEKSTIRLKAEMYFPLLCYYNQSKNNEKLLNTLRRIRVCRLDVDPDVIGEVLAPATGLSPEELSRRLKGPSLKDVESVYEKFNTLYNAKTARGSDLTQQSLKAVKLVEEMKEFKTDVYCPCALLLLCSIYTTLRDAENAVRCYENCRGLWDIDTYPFLWSHYFIVPQLASLLLDIEKYQDAVNLLSISPLFNGTEMQFKVNYLEKASSVRKLLKKANDMHIGGPELMHQLVAAFEATNHTQLPFKQYYGMLVCAYLDKKQETAKATELFLQGVTKYKSPAASRQLLRALIVSSDEGKEENLKKVVSALESLYGAGGTVVKWDLFSAYVDAGQYRNAVSVFKNDITAARSQKSRDTWEYILRIKSANESIEIFRRILRAARDMPEMFSREELYQYLLRACEKGDNAEAALSVWEDFQEENLPPSDRHCALFTGILSKSNVKTH